MKIYKTDSIAPFEAMDKTIIKEIFHPQKTGLNLPYSLAHATLPSKQKSLPHVLKESSEVYYILEGQGKMFIDSEDEIVTKGDVIFIPKGAIQFIENLLETELRFLCIVSPEWKADDEFLV